MFKEKYGLPSDIELLVYSYLLPEEIENIALTNKNGHLLANDDDLLKIIANVHFSHLLTDLDESDFNELKGKNKRFCKEAVEYEYPYFHV